MADTRKPYTVEIGGVAHTLLLSADDVERYAGHAVEVKQVVAPVNKARVVPNKSTK